MPQYAALIFTRDVDWTAPEQAERDGGVGRVRARPRCAVIRGGAALYPTSTATTVRVEREGRRGDRPSDGPYAETKEALTGFYLLECADLDEAIAWAAKIPAAWDGAVEVRPVIDFRAADRRSDRGRRGRRTPRAHRARPGVGP